MNICNSLMNYEKAYFEYFESCDFSREDTNIETNRSISVYV